MIRDRGPIDLTPKNTKLVPQDDDLEILGPAGSDSETRDSCYEAIQDAMHEDQGSVPRPPRSTPTTGFSAPTGSQ